MAIGESVRRVASLPLLTAAYCQNRTNMVFHPMSTNHFARTAPTVPTRPRADGWTAERQHAFLEALGREGSVAAACRQVGLSHQSAYALRARGEGPGGNPFAAAWDAAVEAARASRREAVDDAAFTRALHGWVEPIWYRGEQVGERTRYDARLLMKLLELQDRAEERAERAAARAEREAERRREEAERQAQAEQRAHDAAAIRLAPASALHPTREALIYAPPPPRDAPPHILAVLPPHEGARLTVSPPNAVPPHLHPGETRKFRNFQPEAPAHPSSYSTP
jgi:molybdenum-dependent DNA-binding transcriptional regulator ModE